MRSQLTFVSLDISNFLLVPFGMALLSLPICAISQEWFAIAPFAATSLIAGTLSVLLRTLGQSNKDNHAEAPTNRAVSLQQTFVSVAIGWLMVSAIGALPIWLTALAMGAEAPPTVANFTNGLNALFEGFSGFTSAGLSMAIQPSQLPASLQWWRSFMQWVGGVGVIVLAIALLEPTQDRYVLYQAEGRQARLRLTVARTVQRIWAIYTGYTVVGVLLFRACGMTWWAALNHGMSAISTGGFTITDDSMGTYGAATKLSVMAIMVCGAISFSIHDQILVQRQLFKLWQDHQHRLLIGLLTVGTGIVGIEYYRFTGQLNWIDSSFQWISALTTCGFNTQSIRFWSSSHKIWFSLAMIIGGAAGSTVGGIKLSRVMALWEAISWRLRRTTLSPRQISLRQINGQRLSPDQASRQIEDATALTFLWIISVIASVLILIPLVPADYRLSDIIFESASALGAVGLSVGITGPTLSWEGKSLLIFLMWMGRLEILPVLMLLYVPCQYFFNRR